MTVSLIFATYNHAKFLPECLRQVVMQSRQADEIIVVNDGSTDDTADVLRELARRYPVRIITNVRNLGANASYNIGLTNATSDFVAMLPDDDGINTEFLAQSMDTLATYPQARLVLSPVRMNDRQKGVTYIRGNVAKFRCFLSPQEVVRWGRNGKLMVYLNGAIFHRKTLLSVGGYLSRLRWHADWFALFSVAFRHGFAWCPKVLTEFNKWGTSFSADGMRGLEQANVLHHAMELLDMEQNDDVAQAFRESGVLANFGWPMMRLVLKSKFRHNITRTFLKQWAWWTFRVEAKKRMPRWMVEAYHRRIGAAA